MTVYPELLSKTSEELREMAKECANRSAASWERSDTDGFMSQWANDTTARVYNLAAELADNDWMAEGPALFDLEGNLVTAETFTGQYGISWVIKPQNGGKWAFISMSMASKAKTRRTNMERKGYREGTVRRRVVVATGGSMTCISVYAMDDRNYPELTVVSTDEPGSDWS